MSRRQLLSTSASMMVGIALAISPLGQAQSKPGGQTRFHARLTRVKPDMVNEWLALQKNEVNPALKKAGISRRTLSAVILGNDYQFLSISPLDSFSPLDGPDPFTRALGAEGADRLRAKLGRCVVSSRRYIFYREENLSQPPEKPAAVTVSSRRRIAPGKRPAWESFYKTEILPLFKKAKAEGKIAGFSVTRRSLGALSNEVVITTYLNKFADLDAGNTLARVVGQEAADKIIAKDQFSTAVETVVRRRIADISY